MRLKTKYLWLVSTIRYPDEETWVLVRTALESIRASLRRDEHLPPIKVKLTNSSSSYCGRAHWMERDANGKRWARILVRVGTPSHFPLTNRYPRFTDMPEYEISSYREAIVGVTAHEIAHVLGASGRKVGETLCELCLQDAIDLYRRDQATLDTEIEVNISRRNIIKLPDPERKRAVKLTTVEAHIKRWESKLKLAQTKLKKYRIQARRLQKQTQLALAATHS